MEKIKKYNNLAAIFLLVIIIPIVFLYLGNIYKWSQGPYYGIAYRKFGGWSKIGKLSKSLYMTGMRLGDQIIEINGKAVKSLEDTRSLLKKEIGSKNIITILRDGEKHSFVVETVKFGWKRAFLAFGVPWIIGILFICIGMFIFFTTPQENRAWSFFLFCYTTGLIMVFFNHGRLWMQWMGVFELLGLCFFPATMLHMCFVSPFIVDQSPKLKKYAIFPYLFSLVLFIVLHAISIFFFAESPKFLRIIIILYILLSVLTFIIMLFYQSLKTEFRVSKLKIRIVLMGFFISSFLPIIEPVLNDIFNIVFMVSIDLAMLPFITLFPLSIGYAIAKHDLFEIDVFIKRTTGYLLSTGFIASFYLFFIFLMNRFTSVLFIKHQQLFHFLFILVVIYLFNPIEHSAQDLIDKIFYRKRYDYKEPVSQLLKEMTSIFELSLIIKRLHNILSNIMFIEDIHFFLYWQENDIYSLYNVELNKFTYDETKSIPSSHALVKLLNAEKQEIQRDNFYQMPKYRTFKEEIHPLMQSWKIQLVLPFITHNKLSGFIFLGNIKSGRAYDISDIETLKIIADQVAIAIENVNLIDVKIEKEKIQEELKIAGTIQRRMLPAVLPEVKDFYLYVNMTPSAEVGGDFYDFIEFLSPEGKNMGIVLGDVSGHGISGAFLMSAAHSISQIQVLQVHDVVPVMREINKYLLRETKKKGFVALTYALLLPDKQLCIANAGQPSPLFYRYETKQVSFLENNGDRFPLGIIDDPSYVPLTVSMQEGDCLLFYTDGIVEIENHKGELFSFDRLMELFKHLVHLEPKEIHDRIILELMNFSGKSCFEDDTTIIIIKHKETHPLDFFFTLPFAAANENILIESVESFAKFHSLDTTEIKVLLESIRNFYKELYNYNSIFNLKIIVTIMNANTCKENDDMVSYCKIVEQMVHTFQGREMPNQLQGVKAEGPHFCMWICEQEMPIKQLNEDEIARLIISFSE